MIVKIGDSFIRILASHLLTAVTTSMAATKHLQHYCKNMHNLTDYGWSFTSLSGFCLLLAMTSLLEGVTSNCELCHKPGWRCHGATASVTLVTV